MDFQHSLSDLREAIQKDDIGSISKSLSKILDSLNNPEGVDVKRSILCKAATYDDCKKFTELLLNLPDFKKFSLDMDLKKYLNRAILKGNLLLAEFLLMKGVKLDDLPASRFVFFRTNLKSRQKMLKLLIKYGFNAKIKNKKEQNLLFQFIENYYEKTDRDTIEIADILINSGISVNDVDIFGAIILNSAIYKGSLKLISFLIQKGAKVNHICHSNEVPLTAAIHRNNKNVIDLLLSKGADINFKNEQGCSPIHQACDQNAVEMLDLLIQNGAQISSEDNLGRTPFKILRSKNESNENCRIVIIKEFARLTFENMPVCRLDMAIIQGDPDARQIFHNCLYELDRMSNDMFYSPYSYYSMMKKPTNKIRLVNLMNNKQLFSKFKEYLRTLTYYKDDLRRAAKELIEIRDKHNTVISRLNSIFKNFLPKLVIENFANYLSVEDLPLQ